MCSLTERKKYQIAAPFYLFVVILITYLSGYARGTAYIKSEHVHNVGQ